MRRYAIWGILAVAVGVFWLLWRSAPPPPVALQETTPPGMDSMGSRQMSPVELAGEREPTPLAALEQSLPRRYLIRSASLSMEVEDTGKALNYLNRVIAQNRGYIADLQEWTDELGNRSVTVTFRVPAAQFDSVLESVRQLGKVFNLRVSSEDVTEQFVDVQAQLRNLKRTEERLLGHLSRTARLADILAIERELSRVRQQIEQLEGRMRFLEHRVEYCTFQLTMQPRARVQPFVPPESFSTAKVASDAVRALVAFLQRVWSVIVWLGIWAVIWAPLGAGVWWGYYRWRKRHTTANEQKGLSPNA